MFESRAKTDERARIAGNARIGTSRSANVFGGPQYRDMRAYLHPWLKP
jgi:hypothetical protein